MQVIIKRADPTIQLPAYQTNGAAGFDLAASEAVTIPPRGLALIPTGLVIKVPEGYFLMIAARSSLARKKGLILANGIGVIDSDYCGNDDYIFISVYNITDAPIMIEAGERIANGIFTAITQATWNEVESMTTPNRGGFGSTG